MQQLLRAMGRSPKVTWLLAALTVVVVAVTTAVLVQRGVLSVGDQVRPGSGEQGAAATVVVPFSRDATLAGWRVGKIQLHREFIRVSLRRGGESTVLEINSCKKRDFWCVGSYRVQPAPLGPGRVAPPRALLLAARNRLASHPHDWQTYATWQTVHDSRLKTFLWWTLLAPLVLLFGGLAAGWLLRSGGRLEGVLQTLADTLRRGPARLGAVLRSAGAGVHSALGRIGPWNRVRARAVERRPWMARLAGSRPVLGGLLIVGFLLAIAPFRTSLQAKHTDTDPLVYLTAVKMHQQGDNPYDGRLLQRRAGVSNLGNYTYPPYMLRAFSWMSRLSIGTVNAVFLILKAAALLLLLWFWTRVVRSDRWGALLLLLLVAYGFHRAVELDLCNANISLFEQAALWGGLAAFLSGRRMLFVILVVAASAAKLHWIGLLVLPVLAGDRRGTTMAAFGVAVISAGLALSLGLQPLLGAGFVRGFGGSTLIERGDMNPGSLSVMTDLVAALGGQTFAASRTLGWQVYAVFAAAVSLLALPALMAARRSADRIRLVMLTVVLYALILPQLKDYSYILLIAPTYYAVRHLKLALPVRATLLLGACMHLFVYQSWVVLLGLFVIYLLAPAQTPADTTEEPVSP